MVLANPELAYLMGMIAGNGQILRGRNETAIIIEISHKNLTIEGMDTKLSVKASLEDIRNSLGPLTSSDISSIQEDNKTVFKFTKKNEDFLMREINRHFSGLSSCKDFRVPNEVFTASRDVKKEFLIGLADVTAHIRRSNSAFGFVYGHRVYIEILSSHPLKR